MDQQVRPCSELLCLVPTTVTAIPSPVPSGARKNFSEHHFNFRPPFSSSWWVGRSLAEGRASACSHPSFRCLEVFSNLFHVSVIPALLACPELKEMLCLGAKKKSLQSQSTRDICGFLYPIADNSIHHSFFPLERLLGFGGVSFGSHSPLAIGRSSVPGFSNQAENHQPE